MKIKSNQDYVRLFHTYIYKHVAYALLLLLFILPFVFFHEDIISLYEMITHQQKEWKDFVYNDPALMKFEGNVRLRNDKDEIVYEGYFVDGKCNGTGVIYEDGKKRYEGIIVNNQMEDVNGKLFHSNGTTAYVGEIHNNMKSGMGTQYRSDSTLEYKGMFVNDRFEGVGMAYDSDGNIRYEGDFLDGVYHGKGVLYEEGKSVLKVYEGDFAFGKANGKGVLYDTWGKAYYEGLVSDGHINYTAYYNESLKVVKEHFFYPMQYYIYEDASAIVIEQLQIMMIPQVPLPIDLKTWTKKDWKDEEIIIEKVALVDGDVDEPGASLDKDTIVSSWRSYGICKDEPAWVISNDIIASSLSKSDLFSSLDGKIIEHDENIFEVSISKLPVIAYVLACPYEDMQITYRSFLPYDHALYSVMETHESLEVSK